MVHGIRMLRTRSAYELWPAWPHGAVLVHLQSQRSFLISLKPHFEVSPTRTYTDTFAQTKPHTYYKILSLKQILLIFVFYFDLVWLLPFLSCPTTTKEKKNQPLQYIFTILQQRHRQKGLLLSYFRNFTLSRKSSKALDEPGRVGEGCKGTPHYILYRCSSLLSYTHHRQLQPYKF